MQKKATPRARGREKKKGLPRKTTTIKTFKFVLMFDVLRLHSLFRFKLDMNIFQDGYSSFSPQHLILEQLVAAATAKEEESV